MRKYDDFVSRFVRQHPFITLGISVILLVWFLIRPHLQLNTLDDGAIFVEEKMRQLTFDSETESSRAYYGFLEAYLDSAATHDYLRPGEECDNEESSSIDEMMRYQIRYDWSKELESLKGEDDLIAEFGKDLLGKTYNSQPPAPIDYTVQEEFLDEKFRKIEHQHYNEDFRNWLGAIYRRIAFLQLYISKSKDSIECPLQKPYEIEIGDFCSPNMVKKLLSAQGKLSTWETGDQKDLPNDLLQAIRPLLRQKDKEPFILGYVHTLDERQQVNQMLQQFTRGKDLWLSWSFSQEVISTEPSGKIEYGYRLYCLRNISPDKFFDFLKNSTDSYPKHQTSYDFNSSEPMGEFPPDIKIFL